MRFGLGLADHFNEALTFQLSSSQMAWHEKGVKLCGAATDAYYLSAGRLTTVDRFGNQALARAGLDRWT